MAAGHRADLPPGRRALVVGNSDGIGLALTRRLLAGGWTVAGLSRRRGPVDHDRYAHRVSDVTAPGYPAALAELVAASGVPDVCVYAAGVGEFLDLDDLAAQTATLEVNLLGAARTVEGVVPGMVAAGRGHLVVLSSLADAAVSRQAPGYAASKAALTRYCLGLGPALRARGVALTVVRLGFVDTKLAKGPVTPLRMPVERAVDVVLAALARRPAVISRPRRMAVAVRVVGAVEAVRVRAVRARPRA